MKNFAHLKIYFERFGCIKNRAYRCVVVRLFVLFIFSLCEIVLDIISSIADTCTVTINLRGERMKVVEVSWRRLTDRNERAQAKLAMIARGDCWHGGARAMVLARRLQNAQFDADAIVSQAYGSSTGTASDYLAYLCPECGNARLGQTDALNCCTFQEDEGDFTD